MTDTADNPGKLSAQAETALAAYEAMRESKQKYFSQLQAMDEKYKNWGHPTDGEKQRLDELLKVHDSKVSAFNEAMSQVDDTEDRMALIQRLNT